VEGENDPGGESGVSDRLPAVQKTEAGPLVRAAYAFSSRQYGKVLEPLGVSAHHRPTMLGMGAFEAALERSHGVPERLKVLGELKAALMAGCEFCMDIGSWIARGHGVTEEELRAFGDYRESDLFSDLDRLVIDYAAGMTATPVDVPDELFAELRKHLDEAQIVELTATIAWENWRARFNWALGIESQDFSEGSFCVRPPQS
jgi:AhpD family alkylhydroperoxidase